MLTSLRPPPASSPSPARCPTSGRSLTIETAAGLAVTLTHLGTIAVAKGATVAEGDVVAARKSS